VVPGLIWTQAQCDTRFDVDSAKFAAQVAKLIGKAPTTQHQFDAIVCLTYNIGLGNLAASTLLKKHLAGDPKGAAAEFGKWNKANHKVLQGLVTRRAAEAALYATPDSAPAPKIG
jgi:GH24 family phage-related lysozyme (muramidase)